ncbi:type VI secretion system-associated protein TagF [Paraburkholderia sp. NMBU_R16]|uniref:type VI secretion system-associated protein TagF n=1 Tax=Paraburkholderia sp. NMBU_R16 TaxID=2698676 RepID=UPI001564CC37|nr:type VI secretion system-associated protein TagF [Paraburkholderia sp. NMBU_R16]NRO97438.1 type VI secretion system-associated protein TagF [Paraburkholderia sp. NMBU_R16]
MSAVPMSDDATLPAWYGKIPSAGDFVNRRLPHELALWWERWMQLGVSAMRQRGAGEIERYYTIAPAWNFLIPAGAGASCVQAGCLAPSCDRVGRYYPLIVTQPIAVADYWSGLPDDADAFYRQIGIALIETIRFAHSPGHFEQALAQARLLPRGAVGGSSTWASEAAPSAEPVAWPALSQYFDPHGATSFWWTHRIDGSPLRTHAHTGVPDARLFVRLFGAQPDG